MDPEQKRISQGQSPHREQAFQEAEQRITPDRRRWENATGTVGAREALRDIRFPCALNDIAEQAGDRGVVIPGRMKVTMRRVLGQLSPHGGRESPSPQEFEKGMRRCRESIRNPEVRPEPWLPASPQFRPED